MAVPCALQPKRWENWLTGSTQNEGVVSLWKGQLALYSRPARFNATGAPTRSTRSVRAIRSSMKALGMRPAMDEAYLGRVPPGVLQLLPAAVAEPVQQPQHGSEDQDEQDEAVHPASAGEPGLDPRGDGT